MNESSPRPWRQDSIAGPYVEDSVALLRFVRRAQGFGMTLKEVKQVLTLALQGQRPCERVRELARKHLQEINGRIRELELLRARLRGMLRRRAERTDGTVCSMIEASDRRSARKIRNRFAVM